MNTTKAQRLRLKVNDDLETLHRNVGDALTELKKEGDTRYAETEAAMNEVSIAIEAAAKGLGDLQLTLDMIDKKNRAAMSRLWFWLITSLSVEAVIVGWIVFVNLSNR